MYLRIDFWRFLLGLMIAGLPLEILHRTNRRWAWAYATLILLMMMVSNWVGLRAFADFIQREL